MSTPKGEKVTFQDGGALEEWPSRWVGIPFLTHGRTREGCDCWGLVRLVYAERAGIQIPGYGGEYEGLDDVRRRARAFRRREGEDFRRVTSFQVGDVVLMRTGALPLHVGLFVGYEMGRKWILNTDDVRGHSYLASLDALLLRDGGGRYTIHRHKRL